MRKSQGNHEPMEFSNLLKGYHSMTNWVYSKEYNFVLALKHQLMFFHFSRRKKHVMIILVDPEKGYLVKFNTHSQ